MSSDVITLSEIPTVSELYKSSTLQPPPSDISTPEPSTALNSKVALIRTSITDLEVTSIVNAANKSLLGGGGVDGAIHRAAGHSLLSECRTLGGCETGSAKITSAHALPSSHIIHAVGPVYASAKRQSSTLPAELLGSCYQVSLDLAAEKGGSIAFSCLSTGVYGYPSREAAGVALGVVRKWLVEDQETNEGKGLERVVFCCFEAKDERAYTELIPKFFPPTPSDLPSAAKSNDEESKETAPEPSAPLDTQASSLVAAAEASANGEPTTAKKLKVTNPDPDMGDDWETVEKPEDFLADEETKAPTAENVVEGGKMEGSEGPDSTLAKNALLKDW